MTHQHDHDDHAGEPVPGLPAHLPDGEKMLWQGQPLWWPLAVHAFHVRKVALYFALLALWRIGIAVADGESLARATRFLIVIAPFALFVIGFLLFCAWRQAKMTMYTITTKRVVIRSGITLDVTVNLPFKRIDAAGLHLWRDGTGDLPLRLNDNDRIAILAIWPHMRPWRWRHPEPMLRSVPDPERVAQVLSLALAGLPVPAQAPQIAPAQTRPEQAGAPDFRPAT